MLIVHLKANHTTAGLILHGGNKGDCLHAPGQCLGALEMLWTVEIYIFLNESPLPRRKCLGALAFSKTSHTGLLM